MTKPIRYKLIAAIFGIVLIWVISGSFGIKDIGVALLVGLLVAFYGIVPFIIGIISQALFKKRRLSSRAAMVLAAMTVAALICINGKLATTFFDGVGFVVGTLLSLGIFHVFIDAGINTCNAFRQGKDQDNNSIQRTANSRR